MSKIKEWKKIRARDLSEMEMSNMSDSEFKVMLMKILSRIEKGLWDLHEILHKKQEI